MSNQSLELLPSNPRTISKKTTTAIQARNTTYSLSNPKEVTQMALILKKHIIDNGLAVQIRGKNYVMVEGWQFGGGLLGIYPRITEVKELGQGKWMAKAELFWRDKIVSVGYALCSKAEAKKAEFDEYAILSMAQTRAIGKAYRNIIGWVIKMAGYEGTPAEEIKGIQVITKTEGQTQDNSRKEAITNLKAILGGKTEEEKLAYLKRTTGVQIASFNGITEEFARKLYARVLNRQVKPNA